MKTGISLNGLTSFFDYGTIIGNIADIGYDCVDFSLFGDVPSEPLEIFSAPREKMLSYYRSIRAELIASGVTVSQCHALYRTNFDGSDRLSPRCLDLFRKQIEAAAVLGSPYIVIHPINLAVYARNKQLDFERNMESFSLLKPTLDEFGVKLGVENMFAWDSLRNRNCPTGCSTPEDMIKYIDNMNSDTFVACLDTGHMLLNCVDPADAVRALGSRLKLLHVHDNYALNDNHNAPGLGAADWHSFIKALKEIGYDGCFSMEISFGSVASIDSDLIWPYLRYAYAAAKKLTASL